MVVRVGVLGDVCLAELEERLGAVLRRLRGGRSGGSGGLGLGGLGGVVRSELGREVRGEGRGLGLGRERVRLDGADVGVLGLRAGSAGRGGRARATHLGRGLVGLELLDVEVLDEVCAGGGSVRTARVFARGRAHPCGPRRTWRRRRSARRRVPAKSDVSVAVDDDDERTYGDRGLPEERRGHGRKEERVTVTAVTSSILASVGLG